jgi:hypothetical protein
MVVDQRDRADGTQQHLDLVPLPWVSWGVVHGLN